MKHKTTSRILKNDFGLNNRKILNKAKALLLFLFIAFSLSIQASDNTENNSFTAPEDIDIIRYVSFDPVAVPLIISEASGISTITVSLSELSPNAVTVNFRATQGTARYTNPGMDFTISNSSIVIPANTPSATISVQAIQDTESEFNETVIVEILSVVGASENGVQKQTITIVDDDEPLVTLSHTAPSLFEDGDGKDTITATLSHLHNTTVNVNLAVSGTATGTGTGCIGCQDFTINDTTITITPGHLSGYIVVGTAPDYNIEPNETVIVDIDNISPVGQGKEYYTQRVTTTILNDDIKPNVSTTSVAFVLESTASVYCNLRDLGSPNPTSYGVCWSKQTQPDTGDNTVDLGPASVAGPYSVDLTGLSSATTYYVRAYATNGVATSYGTQIIFTTSELPGISTHVVSDITTTSVVAHANLYNLGIPQAKMYGFCWSTSPGAEIYDNSTNEGNAYIVHEFSTPIYNLIPGTTYYISAYAINDAGITYGYERTFTTLNQPTVSTQEASSITVESAIANGNIDDLGVPNPTAHGFCWSTSSLPDLNDSFSNEGEATSTGAYTSSITGLNPGTKYYVRAYASNSVNTTYGNLIKFTTLEQPSVTTKAVSGITTNSATGNGNIDDLGVPNPTSHGICWSLFNFPTIDDNVNNIGPAYETGNFSAPITGLLHGNKYYVRAFVKNSAGIVYGEEVTFKTLRLPSIQTNPVTEISATNAVGGGTIGDLGIPNPTQHGLCWSKTSSPTISDSHSSEGYATATGSFTSNLINLEPGTDYFVRAYAKNSVGVAYGSDIQFKTLQAPEVSTIDISEITEISALITGEKILLGVPNATSIGFCWSKNTNPTVSDSHTNEGGAYTLGAFSSEISGLTSGSTYYVRSYAINSVETVYGNQLSFTTEESTAIETGEVTEITETSAIGSGNITSLGVPNPVAHGVCWSVVPNPTISSTCTDEGEAESAGIFTSEISGLTPGITYYLRAYATGWKGTVYGDEISFVTIQLPEIETGAVTDITETSALGNGNIIHLGVPDPISYGICWSTESGPTIESSKTDEGAGNVIGSFISEITGLTSGTTYYVRAFVTNEVGTAYGEEVSFVTQQLPAISATDITDITAHTAELNGAILSIGIPVATDYGVCWSKTINPTIFDNVTDEGAVRETGEFTSKLTNLEYEVKYYVRAFANNVLGTVYSDELSFVTAKGLGLSDLTNNNVKVYGFNNELIISSSQSLNAEITVFNVSGEKVLTENIIGNEQHIQFLQKGVFFVKLTDKQKTITRKVIF